MSTRSARIARDGWPYLLGLALLALVLGKIAGWAWGLPPLLGAVVVFYLFRDPERDIPSSPLGVLSPADGEVISVETVHDPYLDRDATRVQLQMGALDVYITRSPVEGRVQEPPPASQAMSGPHGVWLRTDEHDDVVVVMNRGRLNASPHCFVRFGDRLGQGQRCGVVHFGTLVELYLPANTRVAVKPGQHVSAGSDILATLVHK